jgi:hypothetical protein
MAIEKVVLNKQYDSHSTTKRTAVTLLKGDDAGFNARSVRAILAYDIGDLGNHYRDVSEVYSIIGRAKFILEDVDSKDRKEITLITGDRLIIPPRVAMKVDIAPRSVIIVGSPAEDRDKVTHKYEVK